MNPAGFLVWVTDHAVRPMAQWWSQNFVGPDNPYQGRILKSYPVQDEHAGRPIDELAKLYPCPEAT